MNQSEDLGLKLQKVKLAIAEVNDSRFDTEKQKVLKLKALNKIKEAILIKGRELNIETKAAWINFKNFWEIKYSLKVIRGFTKT